MPVTCARNPGDPAGTIESAEARTHADAEPGSCAGRQRMRRRWPKTSASHVASPSDRENAHGHDDAFADEPRHRRVRRLAIELRRRRELQHAALVHHRDPVGERHRLRLVVRDVDHRRAGALVEARELALHRRAQMHVEIGERLVEQHERRLGHETAGERNALALAARKQRRPALGEAFELDQRERGVARASPARDPSTPATVKP